MVRLLRFSSLEGKSMGTDALQQESTLTRNTISTSLPVLLVCSPRFALRCSLLHAAHHHPSFSFTTTFHRILTQATTASILTYVPGSLTPTRSHSSRSCVVQTCTCRKPSCRCHVFRRRPCYSSTCPSKDFHGPLWSRCDCCPSSSTTG
jgi:hypothetical protein